MPRPLRSSRIGSSKTGFSFLSIISEAFKSGTIRAWFLPVFLLGGMGFRNPIKSFLPSGDDANASIFKPCSFGASLCCCFLLNFKPRPAALSTPSDFIFSSFISLTLLMK